MAVNVSAETCREQYWAKRLTWHMPFPNTHVLFTKRTWKPAHRVRRQTGLDPDTHPPWPLRSIPQEASSSSSLLPFYLLSCGSPMMFSSVTHFQPLDSTKPNHIAGAKPCEVSGEHGNPWTLDLDLLPLLVSSCVTLGKVYSLSEPQFPYLQNKA